MSEIRFERSVRVWAEPDAVHALLRNPRELLDLQPYVEEVEVAPDGAFAVMERVPIVGTWTWEHRMRVRVANRPEDGSVFVRTQGALGTTVRAEFHVQREAEATRVRERVEIECFVLLRPLVRARAISAQEALLQNLADRFRRAPGGIGAAAPDSDPAAPS